MDDTNKNNQLSCYLKDFLNDKNITQKTIQDDLNVSQQYVSGLLNGKRSIGKKLAEKLSTLYGMDPAILLTGSPSYLQSTINTTISIKDLPHDKQMELLQKEIRDLKKEVQEQKLENARNTKKIIEFVDEYLKPVFDFMQVSIEQKKKENTK